MFNTKIVLSVVTTTVFSFSSAAATIAISNFTGGTTNVVTDNAGNLLGSGSAIPGSTLGVGSSGVVAVGTFTINNAAIQSLNSASSLISAFTQFGTDTVAFGTQASGFAGIFDGSVDGDRSVTTGNAYILVGNGNTIATSNEFLVYDTGSVFSTAPITTPTILNLNSEVASSQLVIGAVGNQQVDFGAGALVDTFSTVGFTAVPEPSSIALLGLGVVGFVIRRRR